MLGRQRRIELHGEAEDRGRPQQHAADDRHGRGQGPARRHQHEGDALGRGVGHHSPEVGGPVHAWT